MPYNPYGSSSVRPKRTIRRALQGLVVIVAAAFMFIATAFAAWAADNITITFVRHGESAGNASGFIDTTIPGPSLTALGQQQAQAVSDQLIANEAATGVDYTSIYYSDMVRTQQTAAPFAAASGLPETELSGLHEVQAGAFEGQSQNSGLGRIAYALIPLSWVAGLYGVPMPANSNTSLGVNGDTNGAEFESRFNGAIDSIYADGGSNPVVFSHGMAIMAWTLMNVDNPDLSLMLSDPLNNTSIVTVTGNPTDGWTLDTWDGKAVSQNPNLLTKLFVDTRKVATTAQMAVYNVTTALATGNATTISNAIRDGLTSTVTAALNYPGALVNSIVNSVQTGTVFQSAPAPTSTAGTTSAAATSTGTSAAAALTSVETAVNNAVSTLSSSIKPISLTAPKTTAATSTAATSTAATSTAGTAAESVSKQANSAASQVKPKADKAADKAKADKPKAASKKATAGAGASAK
ncbi:histidine phosphatase family protein [Mycobacterium sp. OTB74]|uniref:histidine phosphatase family protein n=1 Tax=Mycobacterium sp. OTB74 TaxID=1853452 RepID=UPI002476D274|nr:histidine phosphatase family protein [Mycobacterium sp. OTB74]MDH6243744.1 broad specificity phosphatase PhoE [Mycobacterium sp. OTB74]